MNQECPKIDLALVPSITYCSRIYPGNFYRSKYVWVWPLEEDDRLFVTTREAVDSRKKYPLVFPAPTFEELLKELKPFLPPDYTITQDDTDPTVRVFVGNGYRTISADNKLDAMLLAVITIKKPVPAGS